jgi:hypothetical protein
MLRQTSRLCSFSTAAALARGASRCCAASGFGTRSLFSRAVVHSVPAAGLVAVAPGSYGLLEHTAQAATSLAALTLVASAQHYNICSACAPMSQLNFKTSTVTNLQTCSTAATTLVSNIAHWPTNDAQTATLSLPCLPCRNAQTAKMPPMARCRYPLCPPQPAGEKRLCGDSSRVGHRS